jgi:hypothetical protein
MADMFVQDNFARTSGVAALRNVEWAVLQIGDEHCFAGSTFAALHRERA